MSVSVCAMYAGVLSSNNGKIHSVRGLFDLIAMAASNPACLLSDRDKAVLKLSKARLEAMRLVLNRIKNGSALRRREELRSDCLQIPGDFSHDPLIGLIGVFSVFYHTTYRPY